MSNDIVERLEKIVEDLTKYRDDTYTCEMCDNAEVASTDYPCCECKRSFMDYFTLRSDV